MPAAAPAPSCIASRPTAKARCWPTWTPWRSTPSPSIATDRVYAATSPDGKVYRIAANGKPEVFYDPKAKYIWALVFDTAGNLFVATGDQGEIHRVTPDGKGTVFFKSDETHVRSLAIDAKGNLIVGTEPGGLVLRVSPAGEGFVLYQMPKREVTAVAAGSRRRDLCSGGRQPAAHAVVAFAAGAHVPCSRPGAGRGDRRWRAPARTANRPFRRLPPLPRA